VIAVVGRPNVGKSTLVNRLVGVKVTITGSGPLTTRTRIQGVLSLPHAQLIVADTPAMHEPRDLLGTRMVEVTRQAIADADVIVWVLDAARGITDEDQYVAALLRQAVAPAVAVLNKADRASAARLQDLTRNVSALMSARAFLPVSALKGTNVDQLVQRLVPLLPEGPQYFPTSIHTDQPEPFRIAELIREQACAATRQEVPHGLAVQLDEITPRPGQDLLYVRAVILVERLSHKKILIGRGGQVLKRIGERARREIEREHGRHVYLDLWVKVSKDWRQRLDLLRALYPGLG